MKNFDALDIAAKSMLALGAGILVGYGVYVFYLEKSYLSYPDIPFPVLVKALYPGDIIPMKITRCNSDKVEHSYQVVRGLREVNNGKVIPMDSIYSWLLLGCNTANPATAHRVPIGTPPGTYLFYGGAVTHGSIRTYDVGSKSEPFEVLPALPEKLLQGPPGPAGPPGKTGATGATGATGKFWGGK